MVKEIGMEIEKNGKAYQYRGIPLLGKASLLEYKSMVLSGSHMYYEDMGKSSASI